MPRYRVNVRVPLYFDIEVDANSEQEAVDSIKAEVKASQDFAKEIVADEMHSIGAAYVAKRATLIV
jgi:hypothetical protein